MNKILLNNKIFIIENILDKMIMYKFYILYNNKNGNY